MSLLYLSKLSPNRLTDQQMTNLLFKGMEDDHKTGECIFVAGSYTAVKYRLPKSVQLYKDKRAEKILFSGGAKWDGNESTEAVVLKKEALTHGVLEKDILVEDVSLHTKENVLASLLVLDRGFDLHNIHRLLVVTDSFHMRRLYLTLKTYMPSWIQFTLCPVHDDISEENWFLTERGRRLVKSECRKLINYVKMGAIVDEYIGISE